MRSIKIINKLSCRLIPGKFYILELLERGEYNYYLFEFDSMSNKNIYNRNKWICEGGVREVICGKGLFFNLEGERFTIKRYYGDVNWNTITYNDIR
jgi:hypothetical protein